jgi:hypothetical protein
MLSKRDEAIYRNDSAMIILVWGVRSRASPGAGFEIPLKDVKKYSKIQNHDKSCEMSQKFLYPSEI